MGEVSTVARRTVGVLLLVAPLIASGPAMASCKVAQVGEVLIAMEGHALVLTVSLNGHPAKLAVDTGGYASLLWNSSIDAYGLNHVGGLKGDTRLCGAGGCTETDLINVSEFKLGDNVLHDLRFLAAPGGARSDIAGVLGEDFLSAWDLEFDVAEGRLRLFNAEGCGDRVVYWANAWNEVNLKRTADRHLYADVQLNGQNLRAMFDSGCSWTTVMTPVTQRTALAPETALALGSAGRGIGTQKIPTQFARFASLTVGQETIQHAELAVADFTAASRGSAYGPADTFGSHITNSALEGPDIYIGADFFRAHRVFIARSQWKIYFTYAGGPTFGPAAEAARAAADADKNPNP
jgi:predicted aspartyl protease